METVKVVIDNREVVVPQGTTVLKAAKKAGIDIPTLCYLEGINEIGACRICLVEIEGVNALQTACTQPVADGMKVNTRSARVRKARKTVLELIMSDHPHECLTCERNTNCELQTLAEKMGVRTERFGVPERQRNEVDISPAIKRDPSKCVLCRRCVSVCRDVQSVSVLAPSNRGIDTTIAPAFDLGLSDVPCAQCGQCILACPVGAITEHSFVDEVLDALSDPNKYVVVQVAPAIRVTVGEEFGLEPGTIVTGRLAGALRSAGFDKVFDTDFAADLTIMEEGHELLSRVSEGGPFPLITSCSPGWIKFCEHFFPDFLDNLSTCKSPHQMLGALTKTYFAEREGIDPKDIVVVSIMPCTAKKFESQRPEMTDSGYNDVDIVLTTRELGKLLRHLGIDLATSEEDKYDDPLGLSTGAGAIFGTSGGVMEAAIRTVYEVITGKELPGLDFTAIRGLDGVKEAEVSIGDLDVKVAAVNGLANARRLLDEVAAGEKEYHFIEIMCCPGGCIGGGGSPIPTTDEIKRKRMEAIYREDKGMEMRKSHENPAIQQIYEEYLGEPLSDRSHHLLHTHYTKRPMFRLT